MKEYKCKTCGFIERVEPSHKQIYISKWGVKEREIHGKHPKLLYYYCRIGTFPPNRNQDTGYEPTGTGFPHTSYEYIEGYFCKLHYPKTK